MEASMPEEFQAVNGKAGSICMLVYRGLVQIRKIAQISRRRIEPDTAVVVATLPITRLSGQ
jgi:hypothetical protein